MKNLMLKTKCQTGQAITEFNVMAAFVLVPLFIMIPLMGKYIDMKHSSVQAARYMAWERTVWFEDKTKPENTTTAKVKSHATLAKETRQRFFSGVSESGLGSDSINPLWNDRGNKIINSQDKVLTTFINGGNENVLNKKNKQSLYYKMIELLSESIGVVANLAGEALALAIKLVNTILSAVGAPKLPEFPRPDVMDKFQFKGYYRSEISMNIDKNQFKSVFGIEGVPIKSNAAVLTDGWVVEGNTQFAEWTDGFVPFTPLRSLFNPIRDVLSYKPPGPIDISLASEIGGLEFGYVDTDPVTDSSYIPNDLCSGGLCSYED